MSFYEVATVETGGYDDFEMGCTGSAKIGVGGMGRCYEGCYATGTERDATGISEDCARGIDVAGRTISFE